MEKYTAYIRFTILIFMFLLVVCREGSSHHRRSSSRDADPWRSQRRSFSKPCALRASASALSTGRAGGSPSSGFCGREDAAARFLIDTLSAEIFYADLLEGKCQPPPMPGERRKDCP